jgi:hypothetical protein
MYFIVISFTPERPSHMLGLGDDDRTRRISTGGPKNSASGGKPAFPGILSLHRKLRPEPLGI